MPQHPTLTFAFPTESRANAAIDALIEAGIDREHISFRVGDPSTETHFLVRLVATIVLWSIVGGAVGAGLGALIWLIAGPHGTGGLVIQAVSWLIFGHLIGGLWAGYALLADRTRADLPHERTIVHLVIRYPSDEIPELIASIIRRTGGRIVP